jgi:hypothetical protein
MLLAVTDSPDPSVLPPPVPVHSDYFRIRHAGLNAEEHAAQSVVVIFRALADLRTLPIDVNDLITEIRGLAVVMELQRPVPGAPAGGAEGSTEATDGDWFQPTGDLLDRWFLLHQAYFLLNMTAEAELDRAGVQLDAGLTREAAHTLEQVAVLVRAFTAGMAHAAAMPAPFYQEVVRPTMAPPAVAKNLTGVMQLEHRRYRRALRRLLEKVPQPYDELAKRDAELAAARDLILEADLVDMERHVLVAAMLVGGERSLVQRETTPVNATSALREMRHVRGAAYCQMMQFGDRWLMTAER